MVVSHCVGARNPTQVLCKGVLSLWLWSPVSTKGFTFTWLLTSLNNEGLTFLHELSCDLGIAWFQGDQGILNTVFKTPAISKASGYTRPCKVPGKNSARSFSFIKLDKFSPLSYILLYLSSTSLHYFIAEGLALPDEHTSGPVSARCLEAPGSLTLVATLSTPRQRRTPILHTPVIGLLYSIQH